ncbi:BlaI/MecI/CopY family transcriptional regulator [Salibacter sp.]|jgi:predicted transcriptional regulator|uniref:BlaI/MecI/CopY family transcriptional regulator n=1 Tax=Salibacter sp. TaxID=2010995 RepID=UPI00286FDACA|nr:BlaI/MecI/CopY family transcriptional regulator [Salibacter sp.]MDR9398772.1 BlaI/MecI/CopY family transcriptional regulator [Salibacter sp.]MDR9488268.1 BlaI/MecI/CopY family transcriptional regulator [Salibacter sp.]
MKKKNSKQLTQAEEEIMQVLWQKEQAFVKEILADLPDPKPAYNTVSTIVRILEDKGFVDHRSYGRTHQYFPKISKADYAKTQVKKLLGNYFQGSPSSMLSFFLKEKELSVSELDEILNDIKKEK